MAHIELGKVAIVADTLYCGNLSERIVKTPFTTFKRLFSAEKAIELYSVAILFLLLGFN